MEIRQLSEIQYLQTMGSKMNDITKTAEPLVDIWIYAGQLLQKGLLSEYVVHNSLIEAVYVNSDNTYQHILLFAKSKNRYVVIIVDSTHKNIYGYYLLNLNKEYDLKEWIEL